MEKPYVTLDPENGDLILRLPEALQARQEDVYVMLVEKFMDCDMSPAVLARMNEFVETWIKQQGHA